MSDNLYHYTNQKGLMGIIEQKVIWATNVLCLNDASELNYAFLRLINTLDDLIKQNQLIENVNIFSPPQNKEYLLLSLLRDYINNFFDTYDKSYEVMDFESYVCSFSSNGNTLSQWRGYCQSGNAFSLGFDKEGLYEIINQQTSKGTWIKIEECKYSPDNQKQIITQHINRWINECLQSNTPISEINGIKLLSHFLDTALTFKHEKFQEEAEFRIIQSLATEKPEFHEGKSFLVPYQKINLTNDMNRFPLKEIIIGPTPHKNVSKTTLIKYLYKMGIEDCNVIVSEIPFRDW